MRKPVLSGRWRGPACRGLIALALGMAAAGAQPAGPGSGGIFVEHAYAIPTPVHKPGHGH